jgi:hypothetical protein
MLRRVPLALLIAACRPTPPAPALATSTAVPALADASIDATPPPTASASPDGGNLEGESDEPVEGWFEGDAVVVASPKHIHRFDAAGRRLQSAAHSGWSGQILRDAGVYRLVSERKVVTLDASFTQVSQCEVPVGWTVHGGWGPPWLIQRDTAFALLDWRTCKQQPLPGFAAYAKDSVPMFTVSRRGTKIAITGGDESSCERYSVHDPRTMAKLSDGKTPPANQGARGCNPQVDDDGRVTWPDPYACLNGFLMTWIGGGVGVQVKEPGLVVLSGVKQNGCGMGELSHGEPRTLATVSSGDLPGEDAPWPLAARPGAVLVRSGDAAVLLVWPRHGAVVEWRAKPVIRTLDLR